MIINSKENFVLIKVLVIFTVIFSFSAAFAQVQMPRESQRQEIVQTVGDTKFTVVYHRPNMKGRDILGKLVPYDAVWRAGANEATTIEISRDITIDGKLLLAGKYSLHMIPTKNRWTVIINKDAGQWGSFTYDQKQDAMRIEVKPEDGPKTETLTYTFDNVTPTTTTLNLRWEKFVVGIPLDIGDLNTRILSATRAAIAAGDGKDNRSLLTGANFILSNKIVAYYPEALQWIDQSIAMGETYANLSTKARLLRETGKTAEAIPLAEKAIELGRSAKPPVNPVIVDSLEKMVAEWKKK